MANKILVDTGWEQRVRDRLGVISIAQLPDTAIGQPEIIGLAESNIISLVPNYQSLDEEKLEILQTATVCECAILLSPSMPVRIPTIENGSTYKRQSTINWENIQKQIMEVKELCLGRVLGLDSEENYKHFYHFQTTR